MLPTPPLKSGIHQSGSHLPICNKPQGARPPKGSLHGEHVGTSQDLLGPLMEMPQKGPALGEFAYSCRQGEVDHNRV